MTVYESIALGVVCVISMVICVEVIFILVFGVVDKEEGEEIIDVLKEYKLNIYSGRMMNAPGHDDTDKNTICEMFASVYFRYFVVGKGLVSPYSRLHKAIKKKFKQLRDAN